MRTKKNGNFHIGVGYLIKAQESIDAMELKVAANCMYESVRWTMNAVTGGYDMEYLEAFREFQKTVKNNPCFSEEDLSVPKDVFWLSFEKPVYRDELFKIQNKVQRFIQSVEAYLEDAALRPFEDIYLVGQSDGTYKAVCSQKPVPGGILFVKERGYPVNIDYIRYDINGSEIVQGMCLINREELLKTLDFAGKAGWYIFHIWDYRGADSNEEIFELFKASRKHVRDKTVNDLYHVLSE